MKPFRFHPEARLDYLSAVAWYQQQSILAPEDFISEIEHAIAQARTHPQMFPSFLFGAQRVLASTFPYSVIYRDTGEEIQIIAVAHGKRRPGYWSRRRFE